MFIPENAVEVKLFRRELMEELHIIGSEDTTYKFHYGTDGACAFDLYSIIPELITIHPSDAVVTIPTGVGIQIYHPTLQFGLFLMVRSGMSNFGIQLVNQIGLIDSDYQGEIMVKVQNNHKEYRAFHLSPGDRIAQAVIFPVWKAPSARIVSEFTTSTDRGVGGFNSTGLGFPITKD
jgi:dUTP pyrophosphatase